ncbi:hypothetical protein UPYG_G00218430 [Umbra pygmaea]|uniref:MRN complex-interacting protein N-terminal domain-containing protein n=1 Tax=Umbra pygmaea TaxID=75934 RepID=A0ABD0WRE3_UMBPY
MVQEFHVLRCYSCQTFQVLQVKKSNKWSCKMCGEKQSVIKEFGRGSGVDCRRHVQKLNARRGAVLEQEQNAWSQWKEVGDMAEEELVEKAQECNRQNAEDAKGSRWTKYLQTADEVATEEEEIDCSERNDLHGNVNIRKGRGARRENGASRAHLSRPKNTLSVTGRVRGQLAKQHSRQPSSLALEEGAPQPSVQCSPPPDLALPSTRSQPLSATSSALNRAITGSSCQSPGPSPTTVQHASKWTQFLTAAPSEEDEANEANLNAPTVHEDYQTIVPRVYSEADREEAKSRVGVGHTVLTENKAPVCRQPLPTKRLCSTLVPPSKRLCSTPSLGFLFDTGEDFDDTF